MIHAIIGELTSVGNVVRPVTPIDEIREDPADNRILECAAEGHVDYIVVGVSGDNTIAVSGGLRAIWYNAKKKWKTEVSPDHTIESRRGSSCPR